MIPDVDLLSYEEQGCLHQMFISQAHVTPHKIAIVDASGIQMTFEELDDITDRLAGYLRDIGVGRNKIVGILMERCIEYSICYIAILKAGGAYLPIELSYPEPLMKSVVEDAEPIAICSKKNYLSRVKTTIPNLDINIEWLKTLSYPKCINENIPEISLDDMAYTVYSSGTTGKPKGIQCPHRGAVFSYRWRHLAYPYEDDEREACNVFFVWEMLRPLAKGITMYIIPDHVIYDPPQLLAFIKRNKITRVLFTPSLIQTILDTQLEIDIADNFNSLKQLWLCGEVVTTNLRGRIASTLPWIKILNLYSISECHDVSCSDLTSGYGLEGRTYCPVGKIFPLVRVLVVDENFNEKEIGEAGEIYIGGPALALGYLKRPDLNEERFIQCPSHLTKNEEERLYRTGDWGYKLSDNSLEVIGRCDSMVKIRGYTVELKAIENALLNIPEVYMACTVVVGPEGSDKMLVAYVVLNNEIKQDISYLRTQLKNQLPFYMIPSRFIFMETLPIMETTGKTNKEKLPEARSFSFEDIHINDDRLAAGIERTIAQIWCEVLRLCTVDADDNFFDLGGHSLLAAVVVGKLNDLLDTSLNTLDLYANPTIDSLTNKIKTGENSRSHNVDLAKKLEKYAVGEISNLKLRSFWKSVKYSKNRCQNGNILLTGAVGFLGSFVLQNLVKNTQATIYCLVRSSSSQSVQQRLGSILQSRSLSTDLLDSARVITINGDISLNKFGLEEAEYLALSSDINMVIHCAASVNLVLPYSALSQTNVLGTHNVVSFCLNTKLKPLHYISTSDVFPIGMKNCAETTNMFTVMTKLTHGYGQTKWVAEQIVQSAANVGLPTIISRCGNIGGCRSSGIWNTNDINLLILQGVIEIGKAPDIDWQIESTSVDFISEIIVKLCVNWENNFGKTYHLINSNTLNCRILWNLLNLQGYEINIVPFEEWCELISKKSLISKKLLPLKQMLDSFLNKSDYLIDYSTFTQQNVNEFLRVQDMRYPQINELTMKKYLDQLMNMNYIPSIKKPETIVIYKNGNNNSKLKNKIALVTGASSGIGYGICETLAKSEVITVGIARNYDKLKTLENKLKDENISNFIPMKVDITSKSEVLECVKFIQSTVGSIDILINNAGVMEYLKMENAELDLWLNMIDVNCKGFLHIIAAVLPQMKERQSGHILNITSDAGRKPFANLAIYSGTKFFVETVSEAMRQEIHSDGIKVTCIQPGDVATGLHEKSHDLKTKEESCYNIEYLEVENISNAVIFALNQPRNCAVNSILIEPLNGPI